MLGLTQQVSMRWNLPITISTSLATVHYFLNPALRNLDASYSTLNCLGRAYALVLVWTSFPSNANPEAQIGIRFALLKEESILGE